MREIPVLPHVKRGLQILLLRKTLQYAFGMDVAFVICAEPFDTELAGAAVEAVGAAAALCGADCGADSLQPPVEGSQAAGRVVNVGPQQDVSSNPAVINNQFTLQLVENGTQFPQEKTQALVFDYSYRVMLQRLKAFRDGDEINVRKAAVSAATFASGPASRARAHRSRRQRHSRVGTINS